MLVKFYEDSGSFSTKVYGRYSFPPRGFVPEENIVYDVEIAGENQSRTVYFLKIREKIGALDQDVQTIGRLEDGFVYNSNTLPFSVFESLPCFDAKPLYSASGRGPLLSRGINEFLRDLCNGEVDVSDFPVVDVNPVVIVAGASQPYWFVNVFPLDTKSGAINFTVQADDTIRNQFRELGTVIYNHHFYLRPGQYLLAVKPTKTFHGLVRLNVVKDVLPAHDGSVVVKNPSRISKVVGWARPVYHFD